MIAAQSFGLAALTIGSIGMTSPDIGIVASEVAVGIAAPCQDFSSASSASLYLNSVCLIAIDSDGQAIIDEAGQKQFKLPARMTGLDVVRMIAAADRGIALAWYRSLIEGEHEPVEITIRPDRGEDRRIRLAGVIDRDQRPSIVISIIDFTAIRAMTDAYERENDHLRYTVELNPELPWIADPSGNVIEFTDRWLALTGLTREDAIGSGWTRVIHPEDVGITTTATINAVTTGKPFDVRFRATLTDKRVRWMRARGFPRHNENGDIIRWYGYTEDVHETVIVEQSIRWNADHDALTGLPNRSYLNRRLEDAIKRQRTAADQLILMLVDVDNFKDVNDIHGHDAGDTLLKAFAENLTISLPAEATVARIGGDEFAIMLEYHAIDQSIDRVCQSIFDSLGDKVSLKGHTTLCRASIGVAAFPQHGVNLTDLFKNADIALYASKNSGRARVTLFHPEMLRHTQERVAMINLARDAARDHSIIAYYQPQVAFEDGRLVGFEALLRRKDRRGGIHSPASLAAAFEDLDVAEALGNAMLERVIADITRWRNSGLSVENVAINVSTAELRHEAYAERLVSRLDRASISYQSITIEVTEGVFLGRSAVTAVRSIHELSRLGFPIALDDFGTGFASLSHLRQIPVDTLKIDRSFVSDLTNNAGDRAIVRAVILLGDELGLKIVAEGIETVGQAMLLRSMGCRYAQGYLCGHPTRAEDIPYLIRTWQSGNAFRPTLNERAQGDFLSWNTA